MPGQKVTQVQSGSARMFRRRGLWYLMHVEASWRMPAPVSASPRGLGGSLAGIPDSRGIPRVEGLREKREPLGLKTTKPEDTAVLTPFKPARVEVRLGMTRGFSRITHIDIPGILEHFQWIQRGSAAAIACCLTQSWVCALPADMMALASATLELQVQRL